jgi:CubicO group peptidase (beta-lactamase class C family)
MNSTSSRYWDFMSQSNRAALHVPVDGKWASFTRRNADAQSPAGGASSTARDLAQWLRLLLGNGQYEGRQVIDKAALEQAHIPAIVRSVDPKTGAAFYGLGWNVDYREHGVEWSHAGAFSAGARTLVHLIPSEQLGIAILSNAFPTGVPEGIAATFFDLVFASRPTRDWVTLANEVYEAGYKEMLKPNWPTQRRRRRRPRRCRCPHMSETTPTTMSAMPRLRNREDRSSCISDRRASASRWNTSIATYSRTLPWRKRQRRKWV